MHAKEPWAGTWTQLKELGKGGQGTTHLVQKIASGEKAVLKVLRNYKKPQPRARFLQEITNLRKLAPTAASVPRIVEDNAVHSDDQETPLYFVMDYIAGQTLEELVHDNASLDLENAVEITLALAATLEEGFKVDVGHRDLKPKNVIVKSLDPCDVVLVDFGLSYDEQDDAAITRESEIMKNEFLRLPEFTSEHGGRHDARSDITALCGILYYCLTGVAPLYLRHGVDRKPPHRREGGQLGSTLGNAAILGQMNVFFDRGFSSEIEDRFETIEEFRTRLQNAVKGLATKEECDLSALAERLGRNVRKRDRKSQLTEFQKTYRNAFDRCRNSLTKQFHSHEFFHVEPNVQRSSPTLGAIQEYDSIGVSFVVELRHAVHAAVRRRICFLFVSKAHQCCLMRQVEKKTEHGWEVTNGWEQLFWNSAARPPDVDRVDAEITQGVSVALRDISNEILNIQ